MSAWMNGKSQPSLGQAIGIADLFQVSTDRLMGAGFADLLTGSGRLRKGRPGPRSSLQRSPAPMHSPEARV